MTSFVSSRRTSATGYRPNAPDFHAKVQTNHDPFMNGSWFVWTLAWKSGAFGRYPVALVLRDETNDVIAGGNRQLVKYRRHLRVGGPGRGASAHSDRAVVP